MRDTLHLVKQKRVKQHRISTDETIHLYLLIVCELSVILTDAPLLDKWNLPIYKQDASIPKPQLSSVNTELLHKTPESSLR